jgi:hypothetical protein
MEYVRITCYGVITFNGVVDAIMPVSSANPILDNGGELEHALSIVFSRLEWKPWLRMARASVSLTGGEDHQQVDEPVISCPDNIYPLAASATHLRFWALT